MQHPQLAPNRSAAPARKVQPPTLVGFAVHQEGGQALMSPGAEPGAEGCPTRRLPAVAPAAPPRSRRTDRALAKARRVRDRKLKELRSRPPSDAARDWQDPDPPLGPRRRHRVWLAWLSAAILAGATVFAVGRHRAPAPTRVATAKKGAVGARVVGIGRLQPVPTTPVPAPEPAVVSQILVEPGEAVSAGQPLIRLTNPAALIDRRRDGRALRRLRQALRSAQQRVRQMQAAFGHEPRLRDMIETGHRAVALARRRLLAAERASARERARLRTTEVPAPHDGFVARIEAKVEDAVLAGAPGEPGPPLLWLSGPADLELWAEMEPAAFGQVKVGQGARVTFLDGNAVHVRAVVDELEDGLRQRPDGSQALGLRLRLEDADQARDLRPGQAAKVEISTAREALLVPRQAIRDPDGRPTVIAWSEARSAFRPMPVVLGVRSAHLVEIRSGLQPGTRVRTRSENRGSGSGL